MSKGKLQAAIDKSRKTENDSDELVTSAEAARALEDIRNNVGMVEVFDPLEFVSAVKSGKAVMAEKYIKLQEGQQIRGYLVARGVALMTEVDPNTNQVVSHEAERLRFALADRNGEPTGAVVSILSVTQVETAFRDTPTDGSALCLVAKGGKSTTRKGRLMDEYFIYIQPNARTGQPMLAQESGEESGE